MHNYQKYLMSQLPPSIPSRGKVNLSCKGLSQYSISDCLGKGGFAICYKCTHLKDEQEFAIKMISKTSKSMQKSGSIVRLQNEINIMKQLKHKNIVQLIDSFSDENNHYLVLELCEKLSLNDMLKNRRTLSQPEAKYFLRQLLLVLIYLRNKKILHRDIKTCNILLDKNLNLKLADFGLATFHESQNGQRFNICGTPNYMAPEVIKKHKYSFEVDMWALGVVAYTMIFGNCPFSAHDHRQIYRKIEKLDYNFRGEKTSHDFKDFIKKILCLDPRARMKPYQAINHPFMLGQIPKYLPEESYNREPRYLNMAYYTALENPRKAMKDQLESSTVRKEGKEMSSINKNRTNTVSFEGSVCPKTNNYDYWEPSKEQSHPLIQEKIDSLEIKSLHNEFLPSQPKEQVGNQRHNWLQSILADHPYVVDFSNEKNIGFWYRLSNDTRGFLFCDRTVMIFQPAVKRIAFYEPNLSKRILNLASKHGVILPRQKRLNPQKITTNCLEYQFSLVFLSEMDEEVNKKFKILQQISEKFIDGKDPLQGKYDKSQEKIRKSENCIKSWVKVEKNCFTAFMIEIHDLVQIFFSDGAIYYILKTGSHVFCLHEKQMRIWKKGDEGSEKLKKTEKKRFEVVQYCLKALMEGRES